MEQDKLYVVHWKDEIGQTGHGSPLSHEEALKASNDNSAEFPKDDYWIEEAD